MTKLKLHRTIVYKGTFTKQRIDGKTAMDRLKITIENLRSLIVWAKRF